MTRLNTTYSTQIKMNTVTLIAVAVCMVAAVSASYPMTGYGRQTYAPMVMRPAGGSSFGFGGGSFGLGGGSGMGGGLFNMIFFLFFFMIMINLLGSIGGGSGLSIGSRSSGSSGDKY